MCCVSVIKMPTSKPSEEFHSSAMISGGRECWREEKACVLPCGEMSKICGALFESSILRSEVLSVGILDEGVEYLPLDVESLGGLRVGAREELDEGGEREGLDWVELEGISYDFEGPLLLGVFCFPFGDGL